MKVVGTYTLGAGGGGHVGVLLDGRPISEGIDLRDAKEAEAFIVRDAAERGWVVNTVHDGGHFRADATIDPQKMQFTTSSLREIDGITTFIAAELRDSAKGRAIALGRNV